MHHLCSRGGNPAICLLDEKKWHTILGEGKGQSGSKDKGICLIAGYVIAGWPEISLEGQARGRAEITSHRRFACLRGHQIK
jgi:hypothetical protein